VAFVRLWFVEVEMNVATLRAKFGLPPLYPHAAPIPIDTFERALMRVMETYKVSREEVLGKRTEKSLPKGRPRGSYVAHLARGTFLLWLFRARLPVAYVARNMELSLRGARRWKADFKRRGLL